MSLRNCGWLLGGLVFLLMACSPSGSSTGKLELTLTGIDGLTATEWPGVELSIGDSKQNFRGNASLAGRTVGTYTLKAPTFAVRGNTYSAKVQFGEATPTDGQGSGALEADKSLNIKISYTAVPTVSTTTGTLNLTVSGPSLESFAPNITVTGPGNFSRTITTIGATALTELPAGNYRVATAAVSTQDLSVAPPSTQTNQTIAVQVGQVAQATVTYAPINSSITVQLSGLSAGDVPSVTLRPNSGTPIVRNLPAVSGSSVEVRFANVGFSQYQISVSATRGAFGILGASSQSLETSSTTPIGRREFTLTLRPAGQIVVGGNGTLSGPNAMYAVSTADLSSLNILGNPFIPLASTQPNASTVPHPEVFNACYDSIARSPSKMVFDTSGNLYIVYQGKSVSVTPGCPTAFYNYSTGPVTRGLYLDAFVLKVTAQNLASRQFYTIANLSEVGTSATILTRTGDTRISEYAVPAPGNQVILKSALPTSSQRFLEDFTPNNVEPGVEVTDLDFDPTGNLWFVNKESGLLGCIAAAQLNSSNPEIRFANRVLVNPYGDADTNRATLPAGVSSTLINTFRNPSSLTFDRSGNLWFTSDGWLFGGTNFARLSRINQTGLTCPQTIPTATPPIQTVTPDVRLDVSLNTVARAFFEPSDIVLSPDGNSLWIADSGSNDDIVLPNAQASLCPRRARDLVVGGVTSTTQRSCSVGADVPEESLIQVPIRNPDGTDHPNAAPNLVTEALRTGIVTDRIFIGSGELQQPMAITFDAGGRLWVATNNNMNVTQVLVNAAVEVVPQYYQPQSAFQTALRDRRGKLYGLTLPTTPSSNPNQPRAASSVLTISADINVGLTGVSLFVPSP